MFIIESSDISASIHLFDSLKAALPISDDETEPRMNVITVYREDKGWVTVVVPRASHRPASYFADGEAQRLISPGLLDMVGVMIAPRPEDFEGITSDEARGILREVALDEEVAKELF